MIAFALSYLPNVTENEINNNAYHSYYSELNVGSDLEVQSGGEVLWAVERHEDDSGAASNCPGTHDDWIRKWELEIDLTRRSSSLGSVLLRA